MLGDRDRRNHARFLLKYFLPWLPGFLWKYWNLCGKIVPDAIMVTGLAFKICILRLFCMYSFRAVNDIRNATGSMFRPHEMYFVYLAEYTLLYLFPAAGFEKHFQCEGIELWQFRDWVTRNWLTVTAGETEITLIGFGRIYAENDISHKLPSSGAKSCRWRKNVG